MLFTVILLSLEARFAPLQISWVIIGRCLDSRPGQGTPRGQYTSTSLAGAGSVQSDSTSDVLCADRERLRGPGMGREIGILETEASNKTGHAACYGGQS